MNNSIPGSEWPQPFAEAAGQLDGSGWSVASVRRDIFGCIVRLEHENGSWFDCKLHSLLEPQAMLQAVADRNAPSLFPNE